MDLDLKEWWERFYDTTRFNGSGDPNQFLEREPSHILRAAIMEVDNPFLPPFVVPLLNLVARQLLSRQSVNRNTRLANLFAVIVSNCERALREEALKQFFVLDAKEKIDDTIMAFARECLPPFCHWSPKGSNK